MKRSIFLLSAFAMLLFASCQPEELGNVPNPNDPPEMTLKKTTFSVDNAAGTLTVPVDANYKSFTVTVDKAATWLTFKETKAETKADIKTYSLVFAYTANPVATARTGKATIKLAAVSEEIVVNQAAAIPVVKLSENSRTVNPRGQVFDITVTANDEYTVTNPAWATFDKATSKITVTLNDTGSKREGELVFASKVDPKVKATLALSQKAANVDPELLHILSIGDSFTEGPAQYLAAVLDTLGYKKVRLANIPFDGKTLAEVEGLLKGTEKVTLHLIDNGVAKAVDSLAVDVLSPDDWDAIVLQPAFDFAGDYDPESVNNIVKFIRTYCEFTPLYWNMTWAYKSGAPAEGFKKYQNQKEMYDALVDVATKIAANTEFTGVIPVGTLVQNIRTSYVEEYVVASDKDAALSVNIGNLAAAYLWAQVLTGKVEKVTYKPALHYDPDCVPAITEAFLNTVKKPFEVSPATQYPPYTLAVPEAEAKALIEGAGYTFSDYVAAPFVVQHYGFYNSVNGDYLTSSVKSGVLDNTTRTFAATKILPKTSIPVGSLIIALEGYKYRPDGWTALTSTTASASRPAAVDARIVKVDDVWWGSWNYRAFNIQKTSGNPTEEEMRAIGTKFGIYIPKTALSGTGLEDYGNGVWNW